MYVAVVESNKCLAKKMKENIEKYLGYKCIKITIYINAEEFLKQLFRYDIVFMGVKLTQMDGLEAARQYKMIYPDSMLFIVSRNLEDSCAGYKVGAVRFVWENKLDENMEEALRYANNTLVAYEEIRFTILHQQEAKNIAIKDIIYLETIKRNVKIITTYGEYLTSETITSIFERLKTKGFFQPHKSYLLNLAWVKEIQNDDIGKNRKSIVMKKGKIIPLSRNKTEEMKTMLWEWRVKNSDLM